jgi:hypothetical protein
MDSCTASCSAFAASCTLATVATLSQTALELLYADGHYGFRLFCLHLPANTVLSSLSTAVPRFSYCVLPVLRLQALRYNKHEIHIALWCADQYNKRAAVWHSYEGTSLQHSKHVLDRFISQDVNSDLDSARLTRSNPK